MRARCLRLLRHPRLRSGGIRAPRAALLSGTLLAALVLRVAYYPKVRAAVSPAASLAMFEERAQPNDALGSLGLTHTRSSFAARDARGAAEWLTSSSGAARRFILLDRELLPALNAEFRQRRAGRNLPVLEASGLALLGVSRLDPSETSVNPLDAILLANRPGAVRPLDVEIGDRIRALGWQVVDAEGRSVESVSRRERFRLRFYYELERGDVSGHCTFLHIDHRPTRFSIEHRGWKAYPLAFWRADDLIVDVFEVDLPLHFTAGDYPVYFGFGVLPCHDDRRMPVTRGAHHHHRVRAGSLRVH
jgi:hypothetical protein